MGVEVADQRSGQVVQQLSGDQLSNEVLTVAIARNKNKAEATYPRGNLLEKRRALMETRCVYAISVSGPKSE
jgi:hypothetical protein